MVVEQIYVSIVLAIVYLNVLFLKNWLKMQLIYVTTVAYVRVCVRSCFYELQQS